MNEHYSFTEEENARLSEEQKQKLLAIFNGERLADVYRDVIAKHVFSPDSHPERMDFILQHTMNQPGLSVINSATNEPGSKSYYSKKTISDISAWLVDHRLADLEFQASPQDFIFTRTDIYGSEMLLLQYSAEPGQSKSEIDYESISGVIIIVLMVKSPKLFKEYDSKRYIHRFTTARSDSGLELALLKQMVFVQLDKALELYISQDYNDDEDVELLKLFALIADINNDTVKYETARNQFLQDICKDVYNYTRSREIQMILTQEDFARMDHNTEIKIARREGLAEGHNEVNDLYRWLFSQNRESDVKKSTEDPAYLDTLLAEYNTARTVQS